MITPTRSIICDFELAAWYTKKETTAPMKTSITPTSKSNLFRIPKRMLMVLLPDKFSWICHTLSSLKRSVQDVV
jgi:hypothetical protein